MIYSMSRCKLNPSNPSDPSDPVDAYVEARWRAQRENWTQVQFKSLTWAQHWAHTKVDGDCVLTRWYIYFKDPKEATMFALVAQHE